jgi:class 3 adenylate cyclase
MTQTRRLTAILAADVAGYSRLMGADEEGTHERLKAHLRELIEPKVAAHHGRVEKNIGDGFLADFASVVGTRAMLQWPGSPRSHPKNPRLSNSVSSRSVFARRCSRGTATLEAWITGASRPRAASQRASQKPSRPASKASAIRVIVRPALAASSHQRCSSASSRSGLGSSFLRG